MKGKELTWHEQAFVHIANHWGKEFPIKDLRIPQIKEYQSARLNRKAKPSTINKEKAALSKMFQVLIEANLVDRNPVRDTAPASEKDGQRDVYISYGDFRKIGEYCACWVHIILQTLYMSGVRRGEALSLTREDLNLDNLIVRL